MSSWALVTGATSGIGESFTRLLASNKYNVVLVARDLPRLQERAQALEAKYGIKTHVIQADLATDEGCLKIEKYILENQIDVLINNAGIFIDHPIEGTTYEEWQEAWSATIGINLIGAANASWCALQHMPKNGTSRIVNVGSRGAFRGEPLSPAYGASKAAMVAFGQSIAKALAPMHIGVTTLAPGFVETEMAARLLDGPEGDGIRAQSPFNRVAKPEELAKAVYFLASPDSEWASGAVLDFNGASYLRM